MMKYMFPCINLTLLTLASFFCVQIFYRGIGVTGASFQIDRAPAPIADTMTPYAEKKISFNQHYRPIGARNLFRVLTDENTPDNTRLKRKVVQTENIKKNSRFKIQLKGTVTGGSLAYAVIGDQQKKKESLYTVGDRIQDAYLKEIHKGHVILVHNGDAYRLDMSVRGKTLTGKEKPKGLPVVSKKKLFPVQKNHGDD